MDNATRNIGDMIDHVSIPDDRTPQAAIVTGLIIITAEAEAL